MAKESTKNAEDFVDIVNAYDLDPKEVQLIRHTASIQKGLDETYFNLWKDNPKKFDEENAWQKKDKFKDRKYLAVFVVTPAKETLFTKFYKIINLTERVSEDRKGHFYNLEPDNRLEEYEGNLKIDWGNSAIAWAQIAGNTSKRIMGTGLSDLFKEFANSYTTEVDIPEREKCLSLLKNLEEQIRKIGPPHYIVKGSGGMAFNPTPTPWIGVRDVNFTNNFMNGIYVFYSFPEDMEFLYLAIGQGTDGLKKEVGTTAAKLQLTSNAASLQHIFKEEIKRDKYTKNIDLRSSQNRATAYEDSVVISRKYDINKLPAEEILVKDLKDIIEIYPKMVKELNNYTQKIKVNNDVRDQKLEKELEKKLKNKLKLDDKQLRDQLEELLENITDTDSSGGKAGGRKEQHILRKLLFSDFEEFKCGICKEIRPVRIMVAGHIKPRNECSDKERTDPEIVMPICKIGCDELFEKGYLRVGSNGIIEKNESISYSDDLLSFVENFIGTKCDYFNANTKKYFEFKYELIKNS